MNAILAPTFETERLRLRAHRLADFNNSAAMWADPEVARYIGSKSFTREESWARFLRYPGHWAMLGYGCWLVEEKSSHRFVGDVGLGNFKRAVVPPLGDAPEIGWVLAAWAHGKGYATEAARAVIAWSEAHLGSPATVCLVDVENAPSIRVAEKLGFKEFARAPYKEKPVILFRREGREH